MPILHDFICSLPPQNAIAFGEMLNHLSEDDSGFILDHITLGTTIPSNIVARINLAFIKAGYSQFSWDVCRTDARGNRYDNWFDEAFR